MTVAVFLPTLGYGLVYEDGRDFGQMADPGRVWLRMAEQQIRPLTQLTRIAEVSAFGLEPWGFHLTNVLLHTLNVGLALAIAWLVLPPWAAILAAGVFAWHPMQVEAVAYVSARADLVAGCGVLLALWATTEGSVLGAVVGVVVAVLAKETAVVAWGLVPLWAVIARAPFPIRRWCLIGGVGAVLACGWVWARIGGLSVTIAPDAVLGQVAVIASFLGRLALPVGLSIEPAPPQGWVVALVTLSVLIGALRSRWVGWAVLWTLVCLAPRLVVPLDEGLHDRHFYLVTWGWALCAGALTAEYARERISDGSQRHQRRRAAAQA